LLLFSRKEEMMAVLGGRVCRVLMTGPLAPFAGAYRAERRVRGYTPFSTEGALRQMGRLSCWLEENGYGASELSEEKVERFLAWQRAGGRHRSQWSRPGLVCLLEVLDGLGALAVGQPAPAGSPADLLLASFERYLLVERGLTAATVRGYLLHARRFLGDLGSGGELAGLSASDVTDAVMRKARSGVSVSAVQLFVCALRAFLRFCFIEGLLENDLAQAALSIASRRLLSLPKGISRKDGAALLAACDRRSALGRRDYALIIVLLRLGLRRGEAARLGLDDIDWRAGELVVRGKGGREDRLPLSADVGEAIASYLHRGRPRSDRRELFLQAKAPYEPIAPETVGSAVQRACRRAGIGELGAHRLRHTMACEMVKAEVPLGLIGQVLRHRNLQSTAIYARVDIDQLRRLAQPWPQGGEQR
jgi:integrase/recombinase XerD